MTVALSAIEARILGSLIEKAATTPDNYPLSTNGLRLACNQSSNRDPVVDYDDRTVDAVMLELRQRGLARTVHQAGSRVSKHRHVVDEALGLTPAELAVLAVLLLRGPQTVAELTTRTERYAGGPIGPAEVDAVLDRLAFGEDPLAVRLARRPGEREPRSAHRLHEGADEKPSVPAAAPLAASAALGPSGTGPIGGLDPARAGDDHRPSRVASFFTPDREERRPASAAMLPLANSAPANSAPAGSAPANSAPAGSAPASNAPVSNAPVSSAPGLDPLIEEVLRLRQRVTELEQAMVEQAARIDRLVEELGGLMATIAELHTRLAAGGLVVIDGGTGTEIQRRGGAMDSDSWCAEANRTAPDVVLDVHRAYILAGAELVIANTFATSPLLFDHLGRTDDLAALDTLALALARRAADGRVPVAGSVSTMRPVMAGSDRNHPLPAGPGSLAPAGDTARRLFAHKAVNLAAAGADLLILEMMRDTDYALIASEAAQATGLPIWIGVSVERHPDGHLVGWGRPDCRAEDVIGALAALGPDLMAVMHSSVDDTAEAIDLVRAVYGGPVGVYPEVGHFTMPDWVFAELSAEELVTATESWVGQGASVVGGCCGITPAHIAALSRRFGPRSPEDQPG